MLKIKKFIYFITLLVLAESVKATLVYKKYSTDEMVSKSDTIVTGKVTDISYEQNKLNQVFTYITIECSEILKGDAHTKTFRLFEEGGKTKKYTTAVYGAPSYSVNEEVVLFLRTHKQEQSLKKVIALNQGKYSIQQDISTKEKYAISDLTDIHFLNQQDQATERKIHKFKLDEFLENIKKTISLQESELSEKDNNAEQQQYNKDEKQLAQNTNPDFDWIKWIRNQVVYYANKMSAQYKRLAVNIKGKS